MSEKGSYAYKIEGISLPMGISSPDYIMGHNRAVKKSAEIATQADQRIAQLEQQLAEKDREIAEYKRALELACEDSWQFGSGAVEHYLTRAKESNDEPRS